MDSVLKNAGITIGMAGTPPFMYVLMKKKSKNYE